MFNFQPICFFARTRATMQSCALYIGMYMNAFFQYFVWTGSSFMKEANLGRYIQLIITLSELIPVAFRWIPFFFR